MIEPPTTSAMRIEGVIGEATLLIEGAMNSMVFRGYIERMPAPTLRAGDIVVMDNLSAHKAAGVVEAIGAVGASVWRPPPCSPDLNPIEKMWSKVKTWLRRAMAETRDGLTLAAGDAFRAVTARECDNYFKSSGYGT